MILISQTLLQTWYAVAPSVFTSNTLLGYANGFGDVFDLLTAVILGKFPRNRLFVHLCLLLIGVCGCSGVFYCTQYHLFKGYNDYVIFFGFCAVGIATCFQPMLMLCNVEDAKFTRMNGFIFAVFKQVSWGTTWAISSFVFNRLGFTAIVLNSFVLLTILTLLAIVSCFVDPFQKATLRRPGSSGENGPPNSTGSSPVKTDSEHGAETSPETTPLNTPMNNNVPEVEDLRSESTDSAGGNLDDTNTPHNSIEVANDENDNVQLIVARSYHRERSKWYYLVVMVITGCFTFESAVHSTALEKLMQEKWGFSDSKSINYFCMIPCIAALLFPLIPLVTSVQFLRPKLKIQVCFSLALLAVCNASLPYIPWVKIATSCAVVTVMARTLLLGSMAPFVDLCSKDKKVQAKLIMVQNMCYNGTWSIASVVSGYLCTNYIEYPFVIGGVFEFLLLIMCIIIL